MARLNKKEVIEALTASGVEFDPEANYNDLCALLNQQEPEEVVEEETVTDPKPKIKPSEHAAMCGQATADNHEERIRDLEVAVKFLLGY